MSSCMQQPPSLGPTMCVTSHPSYRSGHAGMSGGGTIARGSALPPTYNFVDDRNAAGNPLAGYPHSPSAPSATSTRFIGRPNTYVSNSSRPESASNLGRPRSSDLQAIPKSPQFTHPDPRELLEQTKATLLSLPPPSISNPSPDLSGTNSFYAVNPGSYPGHRAWSSQQQRFADDLPPEVPYAVRRRHPTQVSAFHAPLPPARPPSGAVASHSSDSRVSLPSAANFLAGQLATHPPRSNPQSIEWHSRQADLKLAHQDLLREMAQTLPSLGSKDLSKESDCPPENINPQFVHSSARTSATDPRDVRGGGADGSGRGKTTKRADYRDDCKSCVMKGVPCARVCTAGQSVSPVAATLI